MKTINWGIIGCGNVTERKSGPAFNKVENSKLVAVMRRDVQKAMEYAQRQGVPKWYSDADELINDTDINAIYVATPPSTHADYAIRAMQAGKPVYVEKPMALTYAECRKMNEVSKQTGIPLFVAYYRRQLPLFMKVKELVEMGKIGQVRTVSIRLILPARAEDYMHDNLPWRVNKEIAGAGYFYDLASHQFDVLDYILGPVAKASGFSGNRAKLYEVEDVVSASYKFESGVLGCGLWCFTADKTSETDEIEITGELGSLSFSTFANTSLKLTNSTGVDLLNLPNPENIQLNLIKTIVNELLGKGKCPSNGITGARTNWVLEEILYK